MTKAGTAKVGWYYRHLKSGGKYELIGRGKMQCATPIKDMHDVAIYCGEDGRLWVRPLEEFTDGRFEELSA